MAPCYKTFVSIGNGKQYFSRLLDAVAEHATLLPQPILVQAGHTPFKNEACTVVDFISMDHFLRHVEEADMLILHAGAGSILNAIKAGKRPIVMPRLAKYDEVVNDHQVSFAQTLQAEGKVRVAHNSNELANAIRETMTEGSALASTTQNTAAIAKIRERLKIIFS